MSSMLPRENPGPRMGSSFAERQKKLQAEIARYQEENLAPRSWELAGEVTANKREPDALLDDFLEVDYRATVAPKITETINEKLENVIKQRIKDNNYDDVVRKRRVDESLQTYRARINIGEIERKSLMEMYEEEYKSKSEKKLEILDNDVEEKERLDAESEAIQAEMMGIFSKLDELCHSNYRPSEVTAEPKVIVNKLAMEVEEVGMKAATAPDEELLAPEEVAQHQRGDIKSKAERTRTDRLRERRLKKKKQHGKTKSVTQQIEEANADGSSKLKKGAKAGKVEKKKSTSFKAKRMVSLKV